MQNDWYLAWLRERLAYVPREPGLFAIALTHRSASTDNNERLEYLGDAVLNLLMADRLYAGFPLATEGDLSRLRARMVSEEPLAGVASALGLGEVLRLGAGELKTGGFRRQSILADALEALVGALFLDAGLEEVRRIVMPLFDERVRELPHPGDLRMRRHDCRSPCRLAGCRCHSTSSMPRKASRTNRCFTCAARRRKRARRAKAAVRAGAAPNSRLPSGCSRC